MNLQRPTIYTNLVNIEEQAQYVRKQSKQNDNYKQAVRNIIYYYDSIKQPAHEQKRSDYGNQPAKGNNSKGKARNIYQCNQIL